MRKQMLRLASVRLWIGVGMLAMGMGMVACHQTSVVPTSSTTSDSTAIHHTFQDDDPPEKPIKPGGN
ncbi:hypothetical protein [Spirosoma litoris]